jgi:hypothetical protein
MQTDKSEELDRLHQEWRQKESINIFNITKQQIVKACKKSI